MSSAQGSPPQATGVDATLAVDPAGGAVGSRGAVHDPGAAAASDPDDPRAGRLDDDQLPDPAPAPALDAVTRLTTIVLDVPIALICRVDGDRVWCTSHHGLAASSGGARELALCRNVLTAQAPLVVDDVLLDPRFAEIPLVTGASHLRFYAGMPLLGPDGQRLGTLCALDHRPRALTDAQLDALRLLAGQASGLLEPRRGGLAQRAERGAPTQHEAALADRARRSQPGTLAAGVGHEINNPLTYVLTNLDLAIEELDALAEGDPSRRLADVTAMLREARAGGVRVKHIVRGLKALARDDAPVVATDLVPAARAPARAPEVGAPIRQGRVLVVDDEPAISKTVIRMFRGELDVVALDDPRIALRLLEAGEPFDVVLCDLTMPYLTGMELHATVSASRPQLAARFVFLSGDLTRHDIRQFLDGVPNERFEKPFDVQELRGIVRRFVRGESPSMIMR